jgi:hypothetical protein
MFFSKKQILTLTTPKVGIFNLGGEKTKGLIGSDIVFLRGLFSEVEAGNLVPPRCDVLFLYAEFTADGTVLGSLLGLREIIRDSGAKVVVVASENSGGSYIKACKLQRYGRANLVMTLNRRGSAFGQFFMTLFSKMKSGISMPVAWNELAPQIPGEVHPDCPAMIFACEIGQLSF